jgi:hypothetical protein
MMVFKESLMKNILTILFILVSLTGLSQELTADTHAVEPSLLSQILQALWAGLAVMLGVLARNAIPLLNAYLKQLMHFRGAGVVADALTQALGELVTETQKALADGVLTAEERKALKARAGEIARERLKNLSGFYKADLSGWVDEQLDVLLGKLLARV